jgi:hypothetical protein
MAGGERRIRRGYRVLERAGFSSRGNFFFLLVW